LIISLYTIITYKINISRKEFSFSGHIIVMKHLLVSIFTLLLLAGCSSSPDPNPPTDTQAAPTSTSDQLLLPTELPPLKPINLDQKSSLIEEIQAHIELYQSEMLSEPGWVHLIIRPDGYDKTDVTYPEAESYEEGWYLLDDQAQVLSAIERLVDERGHTTKTFVFKNGSWVDTSNGEVIIRGAPRFFEQGETFYQQVGRLLQQGEKLSSQTIYSNCWYIGEQYTISDGKLLREAVFDPAMGNLKALKTWEINEAAIELVVGIDILKEERVPTPPAEMVTLLEEAPVP
jgi:hypothetical protein